MSPCIAPAPIPPHAADPQPPWRSGLALFGAGLAGLGLIMWMASQWAAWGSVTRLGLVQAVLVLGLAGAALTGARTAFALLGWLAIGALFALIGQTYQTGADPWQLFALWTALGLPVALAVRHDVLWSGWALVANVAVALWLALQRSDWAAPPSGGAALCAALALAAIWLAVGPLAARWTGAGRWAPRVALTAALVVMAGLGVVVVFVGPPWTPWIVALATVAALAALLSRCARIDLAQLAACALAGLVLVVGGLARALMTKGSEAGSMLLLGLLAAGLLAALAWGLLQVHGRQSGQAAAWPVAALTALGAWLAAVPLLAAVGIWLGRSFEGSFWLVGLLLYAPAVALLRRPGLGAFAEQLMVPVLLASGLALAVGVAMRVDGAHAAAGGATGLVAALLAAALLPQPWLRGVLGAAAVAAGLLMLEGHWRGHMGLTLLGLLLPWLAAWRWHGDARVRPIWLGWAVGWLLLALLAGGPSFLVAGLMGSGGPNWMGTRLAPTAVAVLLAALALGWLARRTMALRTAHAVLPALLPTLVLVALVAAVPLLGGVVAVLAVAWVARLRALLALAVLVALWLVGTLYHELDWPLAHKGLALLAGGALLALAAWRPRSLRAPVARGPAALLLGALAVTLALANHGIWQQEQVLARGRTVYLALAPVDPRSLMQGDYMRLAFELPEAVRQGDVRRGDRVAVRVDASGLGTAHAVLPEGVPAAPGELALPLRRGQNGWTVVSDAFYFREGEAARYEAARFGVLRVAPDGRALLAGLADAQRRPL